MLYSDISIRNGKLNQLKFVDIALSSQNKLYMYELYIRAFKKRTHLNEKSKERYVKFGFNGILKKKMAKKTEQKIELVASGTRIQTAKNVILSVEHIFRIKKEKNEKSSLYFYRLERYTSIRQDMDENRIRIKRDTNVVDTDDWNTRNRDR